MKINPPFLRKLAWFAVSNAAVAAPVAIVIACGSQVTPSPTEVLVASADLAKVRVTGDTRNIEFEVPRELTHVNGSVPSATGTVQAFDVYGRTGLALGSGAVNESARNNFNFMPLPLLAAYVGQRLSYDNNRLVITNGEARVDVLATYGSTFGFSPANVIPARLFGAWSKSEFFLKYVPRPGFTAPAATLNTEVPINVAPTEGTFATYVNLDLTHLTPVEQAEFEAAFSYAPTSTQTNVAWLNAAPPLPAALSTYVSAVTYGADANVPAATLPTSFAYAPAARKLVVNLTPRPGYVLSTRQLDITRAARVQAIPTRVDDSPEYSLLDLTQVRLDIANNKITLDQSAVTLPRGTKLEFRLGDDPWVDSVAGLLATLPATTSPNFDVMRVRLAGTSVDGAVYVVGDDKESALASTRGVTIVKTRAFFARAALLKIDADQATATALAWTNAPILPDELTAAVARVEYLLAAAATEAQADASALWSAAVPTTLPSKDAAAARLWVRLVPSANYFLTPQLGDLTTSSGLGEFVAQAPFVDVSALVTAAQALLLAASSTHDALRWNNPQGLSVPAALTSAVARVEYLSGNYATAASATAAPAAAWTTTLPQLLDVNSAMRYLWVRFVPVKDTRLSVSLLDITTSSRVQEILTRIDGLPAYNDFTTQAVKITVTPDNQLAANTPPLPLGTTLQYRYGATGTWGSLNDLATALPSDGAYEAAAVAVRLFNTDTSKYVLNNDKAGAADASALAGVLDLNRYLTALDTLQVDLSTSTSAALVWLNEPTLTPAEKAGLARLEWIIGAYATVAEIPPDAPWSATLPTSFTPPLALRNLWVRAMPKPGFLIKSLLVKGLLVTTTRLDAVAVNVDTSVLSAPLSALQVDPASTHDALAFTNVPTVPDNLTAAVSGIEYLTGNYPSVAAASAATTWATNLPASTEFTAASRYLYARLVPRAGFVLNPRVFDLSLSSNLRAVRAKVDAQPGYAALDLGQIVLTGTLLTAAINATAVTLPEGAMLRYQISPASLGASGWLTESALAAYLNTNLEQITQADLATLRAHLEPRDATRFVIVDDRNAAVNTTTFQRLVAIDLRASFNAQLAAALVVSAAARHNALTWTSAVPALPDGVVALEFLTGDFSTAAAANAATEWTRTLPITTSYAHAKRFFWVRLTAARGYNIVSPTVLDLTASSQIQAVLALVDSDPLYQVLNLALIKITGGLVEATIDATALVLPAATHLEYQVNTAAGYSAWMPEQAFKTFLKDNYDSISTMQAQDVRARLALDDLARFELRDPQVTAIDTTNFSRDSTIDVAAVIAQFSKMRPAPAATNENATWTNTVESSTSVAVAYVADRSAPDVLGTTATNPVMWSANVPSVFTNDKTAMSLWARLSAAKGYVFPASVTGTDKYTQQSSVVAYLDVTDFTAARTMTSLLDASLLTQYLNFANAARVTLARRASGQIYSKWVPPNANAVPSFLRTVAGTIRFFQANSIGIGGNSFATAAGVHNFGLSNNWSSTYFWTTPPAEFLLNSNIILRSAGFLLELNDNYAIKGRENERYFYVSKDSQVRNII